ncbi:DNA polymerase III, alpha subunit [Marinomonas sp. MED121]|uniref:3'-5' exonuclease n=1 Tax=Marinomonas sp. MED121 TaxID=314277 RepID=UPI0000690D9A|nr:3'-5' exonuclease [Marinomonas sp. MED121]EAQ65165.1 DNA polymerase III, alpha subunit [Marinomonas sp. MED121]
MRADSLVILDFETTGLSPDQGDRAIEIGAVKLEAGEVVAEFQALMNPGFSVTSFIEGYTGISNAMLAQADSCREVMESFAEFIADNNLIAHNASFDRRFLDAEFSRFNHVYQGDFSCSLLLSRRIFQDAPSHSLGALVNYINLSGTGDFHRALYDAQMTAKLWMAMLDNIGERYGLFDLNFEQIQQVCKTPKKSVHKRLESWQ